MFFVWQEACGPQLALGKRLKKKEAMISSAEQKPFFVLGFTHYLWRRPQRRECVSERRAGSRSTALGMADEGKAGVVCRSKSRESRFKSVKERGGIPVPPRDWRNMSCQSSVVTE
jgi:hypothetical protein